MYLLPIVLFVLSVCISSSTASTRTSSPELSVEKWLTINTSNGPVTGHPASNASKVIEYLGIPYAEPPVGDLRFAPPARYSRHESFEASDWGFDCPLSASRPVDYPGFTPQAQRIISLFASGAGTPQSEDCLTLNVWSKPTNGPKKAKKAVLVFFYGGRFAIGNTNSPFYNGQYFADSEDVVVVTVNYRLNIFGFPGIPGEPQNLGLRDQRLAIEWVHENIASFGGDAGKITVFGQSAGGVAVDWWSYAYQEDPIVSGFISHSGNAFSFPLNDAETTPRNWYNVSGQLGCGSSGDTLECMRGKAWEDIKAAAAKVRPTAGGSPVRSIPPFYPTIDDELVFSDYEWLSTSGGFAKLPYLLGSNEYEQGYYVIPAFANGVDVTKAQGDQFLLESFTCPNSFEAGNRIASGVPTWLYRYFGDWENTRLYEGSGAYHGTDLHMIFGASGDVSGLSPSNDQKKMTKIMQRAWASFAKDPANGLSKKMGWPLFNPNTKSLVRLAYGNQPKADFVKPSVYDAPCLTIALGSLPSTS